IVAACPRAEVGDRLGEVFAALSGQTRHDAGALKLLEMAARAADRMLGVAGLACDVLRSPGLAEIGPWLLGKIFRDRHHVVLLERRGDGLHDVVLAIAPFVITELNVDVAGELSPDDRNGLVDRLAVRAVASGTDLDLLGDALRGCLRCARRLPALSDGR